MFAFPFRDENRKRDAYWRDVGTLDAYYEANMDLVAVDPLLNMYDEHWPIRTYHAQFSAAEIRVRRRRARTPAAARRWIAWFARARSSPAARCERSILGANVRVNSYAHVEDSILFDGVDVGRHAQDSPGDHRQGRAHPARSRNRLQPRPRSARGFTVTEGGVVVIAKADGVEHFMESEAAIGGDNSEVPWPRLRGHVDWLKSMSWPKESGVARRSCPRNVTSKASDLSLTQSSRGTGFPRVGQLNPEGILANNGPLDFGFVRGDSEC